jgi:hypothetical protein
MSDDPFMFWVGDDVLSFPLLCAGMGPMQEPCVCSSCLKRTDDERYDIQWRRDAPHFT